MSTQLAPAASHAAHDRSLVARWMAAGALTAVVDGLFSSILVVAFYGMTATRMWQGVASTLLGPSAIDGGTEPALVGIAMHVGVAFGWAAVFLAAYETSARLRGWVHSRGGVLKVAAVFGPLVWVVMSLAVIPILLHRPPSITFRWAVQLIGHVFFVGLPIVWAIGRRAEAA